MPVAPRMRRTLTAAAVVHVGAAVLAAPTVAGGDRPPAPTATSVDPVLAVASASEPVALALADTPTPVVTAGDDEPAAPGPRAAVRTVESTAYCLDGTTASGVEVGPGQAAMNSVPLGTTVTVLTGPLAGRTLLVTDRIGHGTELDVWFDDCDVARAYGRLQVDVVLG